MNEDLTEFGLPRLHLATHEMLQLEATDIAENIMDAVEDHVGNTPQFDDITLVVLKRD